MYREVSVVLPAHNEEGTVGRLAAELVGLFGEVVVVDDGSADRTAERAREQGAVVLRHPVCLGKGAALKTGFEHVLKAGKAAVITMDADGQHTVGDACRFADAYRRKPHIAVWVGRRKMMFSAMPLLRRATNVGMSLLISLVSGQWIPDSQCGFRLIRRDVLERVPVRTTHFEMESEILIRASWRGFRMGSVRIATVYRDEKSKIRPARDSLRFLRMIGGLLLRASVSGEK